VAVNCSVVPRTILGLAGWTAMDTSVMTVRVVEPETLLSLAAIVVVPPAPEVAFPFDLLALLMMATDPAEELQVTDVVRFRVLLSE
jgi:hypothetical protein